MPAMATEPHLPKIDATTGYWFTRWYTDERDGNGNLRKAGKTFGHSKKVSRSTAIRQFRNWIIQRGKPTRAKNKIKALVDSYNEHAERYYRHEDGTQTGEHENIRYALKPWCRMFGEMDVADIRPRHAKEYIEAQIEEGIARSTINKRLGIIKRMLEWAVGEEYVSAEVYGGVLAVKTIMRGRTDAKETSPVISVSLRTMAATLRYLPPVVAAMVRLQWLTGMRPGEVCLLRPEQVDRSRKTWLYTPPKHKTSHRGKTRVVALGPKARTILQPYLFRDSFCFRPEDSRRWFNQRRRENAIYQAATLKTKYRLSQCFTAKTYADAIERAAIKAGVPHWTPNQIRHAAATHEDRQSNRESAKRLLGHASAKTTAIYIDPDIRAMMERAEKAG
jgi:integrase